MNNSLPWAKHIKSILDSAGFSYVWLNPSQVDPQQISNDISERLTDQFKQNWQSELRNTSGKLRSYKEIKDSFKLESYLELPPHLRIPITRLRTSSHTLRIETGRYHLPSPTPADERFCWFCSQNSISVVEDELHFLFDCQLYSSLKEKCDLTNYCCALNAS